MMVLKGTVNHPSPVIQCLQARSRHELYVRSYAHRFGSRTVFYVNGPWDLSTDPQISTARHLAPTRVRTWLCVMPELSTTHPQRPNQAINSSIRQTLFILTQYVRIIGKALPVNQSFNIKSETVTDPSLVLRVVQADIWVGQSVGQ